jgi:hypothetical protein
MVKMVQYCDVCDTFKEWLAKNGHRFNRKFKIRHYVKRNLISIYFEDVTPELHCYVYEGNIGTSVHFKGQFWDLLQDFDYFMMRGKNHKYYCCMCTKRKYYDTSQELLIDHSFENFLEWVNDHFTPFHALELTQCQGMTSARIIDSREPESKHEAGRDKLKEFLSGLRKIGPGTPLAFPNLDNMKTMFIPVIKEKGNAP